MSDEQWAERAAKALGMTVEDFRNVMAQIRYDDEHNPDDREPKVYSPAEYLP